MSSSSEITALLEQARKLKATFDKFAQKLVDEGIINQGTSPLLSPQKADGKLVKPNVSHLPTTHSRNSYDVKESQFASILLENGTTLDVQKIFDKMSDRNVDLNVFPAVKTDLVHTRTPEICWENEVNEVFGCRSVSNFSDEVKSLNTRNELDEIHLPDFIREMAETTNIEEETVAHQVFDELSTSTMDSIPLQLSDFRDDLRVPIVHKMQDEVNQCSYSIERNHETELDVVSVDKMQEYLIKSSMHKDQRARIFGALNDPRTVIVAVICAPGAQLGRLETINSNVCQHYAVVYQEDDKMISGHIFCELAYSQVRIELVLAPNKISMVSFKKSIVLNLIQLDFALTSPTWKHVFGEVLNEISHNIVLSKKFVLKFPDVLPKLNKFIVGQDWRDSIEITSWLPFQYYGIIRHYLVTILEHDNSGYTEEEILYFRRLDLDRFEVAFFHVFVHVRYDKVVFPIKSNQWSTWAQRIYCNRLGARGSYKYFDPGICMLLFHTLTLEDKGDFMGDGMVIENENDLGENGVVNHDKGDNLEDAHDTAISTELKESKPFYISIRCNLPAIPQPTFRREHVPFSLSPRMSNKLGLEAAVEAAAEFLNKVVNPVIVAGPKLRVANKKELHISVVADSLVVLTLDESKEANSDLLPINFNGLSKAVKAGDTIFVSQYLFTGSESTSVWLEVSEVKGKQDELHLVDGIFGTIQRRTWHEDTKRWIVFWTAPEELCDQLKRRVQQPGIRADYLSRNDLLIMKQKLEVDQHSGAAFLPDDCQLDAYRTVVFIEKDNRLFELQGRYAEFYNDPVVCLFRSEGKGNIEGMKSKQNTLYGDKAIINAAGCWSGYLMDKLLKDSIIVVHVPVKPRKGHLIVLENFNPLGFTHGLMEVGLITSVLYLIVLEKDLQVYVFDPGGRYMTARLYLAVRLSATKWILEDKDHFMGWVMIHSENIVEGRLVIISFISYSPS